MVGDGEVVVKVVEPPTANAKECYTLQKSDHLMANSCQHKWDHLLCWPPTQMETTVGIPCNASVSFVDIVTSSKPSISSDLIPGMAYQRCNASGFWSEKTNYDECTMFLNEILSEEETKRKVKHAVSIITFALCLASVILLLIALGIFQFFKSLKCDRLRVHKNFMMSLVIRYVVSVIYYEPYIYGDPNRKIWFRDFGEGYLCKLVLIFMMYGYVAPVFWMFIEGVYLHSRVATNVFDSPAAPFKFYYLLGWCLPSVIVGTWAVTMSIQSPDTYCLADNVTVSCEGNNTCWEGYDELPFVYILSVPMTIALAINLLFLVNIVRILVTKLNDGPASSANHEGTHVRKALRATLILFPLLGITNLLFFINPKNGTHDKIYIIFNASMQSSQGVFLAILYCFLNSEVQEVIKRHLNRLMTSHDIHRNTEAAGLEMRFLQKRIGPTKNDASHETIPLKNNTAQPTEVQVVEENQAAENGNKTSEPILNGNETIVQVELNYN